MGEWVKMDRELEGMGGGNGECMVGIGENGLGISGNGWEKWGMFGRNGNGMGGIYSTPSRYRQACRGMGREEWGG